MVCSFVLQFESSGITAQRCFIEEQPWLEGHGYKSALDGHFMIDTVQFYAIPCKSVQVSILVIIALPHEYQLDSNRARCSKHIKAAHSTKVCQVALHNYFGFVTLSEPAVCTMSSEGPTTSPDALGQPAAASTASILDATLQNGNLQLHCDDGQLLVMKDVLVLASPDVLAGAVELAQGQLSACTSGSTSAPTPPRVSIPMSGC